MAHRRPGTGGRNGCLRSRRRPKVGDPVAVGLVDIDDFKAYNDQRTDISPVTNFISVAGT